MKLNRSNISPSVAARALSANSYPLTALLIIALAVGLCWIVDGTTAALDLEVDLADRMACALKALLRGFCLDETLHCHVAPACSGLRTALAAALFALALRASRQRTADSGQHAHATEKPAQAEVPSTAQTGIPHRAPALTAVRCLLTAASGASIGLWLNLARLLAIELGMRASPALGATLHDFALPLLIAPLALGLLALIPRLKLPQRALLATSSSILLALLINAPAYTIDWEALP